MEKDPRGSFFFLASCVQQSTAGVGRKGYECTDDLRGKFTWRRKLVTANVVPQLLAAGSWHGYCPLCWPDAEGVEAEMVEAEAQA